MDNAAVAKFISDDENDSDNIDPSDLAAQVSDKSMAVSGSESTVQRQLELRKKQAKVQQELKEQEDQQHTELQELKLAQLKLQKAKQQSSI
jgi:hypothetical protein